MVAVEHGRVSVLVARRSVEAKERVRFSYLTPNTKRGIMTGKELNAIIKKFCKDTTECKYVTITANGFYTLLKNGAGLWYECKTGITGKFNIHKGDLEYIELGAREEVAFTTENGSLVMVVSKKKKQVSKTPFKAYKDDSLDILYSLKFKKHDLVVDEEILWQLTTYLKLVAQCDTNDNPLVLLHIKDGETNVVATDGKRMVIEFAPTKFTDVKLGFDEKDLKQIKIGLSEFYTAEKYMIIKTDGFAYLTENKASIFPDYEKVLDVRTKETYNFSVVPEDLKTILNTFSSVNPDDPYDVVNNVKLTFDVNDMHIIKKDVADRTIGVVYADKFPPYEVYINMNLLYDAVKDLQNCRFEMYDSPHKPIFVFDGGVQTMIMPIRMKEVTICTD